MGGLQAWHLLIILVVAAVVTAAVVVIILAVCKPRAGVGARHGAGLPQGPPPQIGYTMNGQPIYQQPVPAQTNVLAILALVLGLFTGILGIVFGHIARSQIRSTGEGGAGLALAGLVIGYVWVGLFLLRVVL
ncbi:MAG: DUF4190 domain-containing protein [Micrococcaceae bacterium]|nr:DUF4190 domain-containing protein [Micrococcaceae bacterium]MDN5888082.1 DUF4190 domain-containing protein [Micrococcaceae bacterium]